MKRFLVISICMALLLTSLPFQSVFAYEGATQKGDIASGQQITGLLQSNDYGLTIPEEYTLTIPKNSIVRMVAYTKSKDYYIEVDSPNNPYLSPESITAIKGADVTQIYESANRPGLQRYGISSLGITSYCSNPSSYTEIFTGLIAGTYKIRVRGGPEYSFKITAVPLKYPDDVPVMSNETLAGAFKININQTYNGNILFNGIINKDFFYDANDYYTFDIKYPGKYKLTFASDGFFQGTASILDASGYGINDGSLGVYFKFAADGSEATTFEKHVAAAKIFTKDINITKAGKYYVAVTPYSAIAGSYQFSVKSVTMTKLLPEKTTVSMKIGTSYTNKITALYSDGTKKDVTSLAVLTSSNKCVKIVKNSFKAVSKGTATITAILNGIKATYTVAVK